MKGIAIIAMLFHHLYCSIPDWVEPYRGCLFWLGDLGKVCVAIFLFCSGYGMAVKYAKTDGLKDKAKFLFKRFISFYTNYWIIFLIFVPITVLLFNRPFSAAYGENVNIIKRLAYDFLGIQGFQSYNITWWFNKLIILLWLLFPFIYWIAQKYPLLSLLGSLIVAFFWMPVVGWDYYGGLYLYQLSFVIGIVWRLTESRLKAIESLLVGKRIIILPIVSIYLFVVFVFLRMNPVIPHFSGLIIDAFLACSIALLVICFAGEKCLLSTGLSFIGKHSGNIYLIHTFVNVYWNSEWLHTSSLMRHGMNFIVLLGISLLFSVLLELLKEKSGVYAVVKKINEKLS